MREENIDVFNSVSDRFACESQNHLFLLLVFEGSKNVEIFLLSVLAAVFSFFAAVDLLVLVAIFTAAQGLPHR